MTKEYVYTFNNSEYRVFEMESLFWRTSMFKMTYCIKKVHNDNVQNSKLN